MEGGGGVGPPTKLSKRWSLKGPQLLEGVSGKEGVTFFRGGCNFHIKNKLKSEIFNDKKSLSAKIFFSVITKSSNWEILPKNLVTFKGIVNRAELCKCVIFLVSKIL